jgi:flagellar protein FlgJ
MNLAFSDLQGLQSITALGRQDRGAALEQVARQFESFFVAQILKGMRAANEVLAVDDRINSNEMQLRHEMLDQQLSVSLTQGKGLGLAAMFARELGRQFGGSAAAVPVVPDEAQQLAQRRTDRAPPAPRSALPDARAHLPPVVRSAVGLLRPVVEKMSERLATVRFPDKESFVRTIGPLAREAAAKLGVDHRALIAQAALETGWGQSILGDSSGRSSFNLFNIKAGSFWPGASIGVNTLEFSHGIPRPQRARFRAYASFAESFEDYVGLLRGSDRYRRALEAGGDAARFIHGLAAGGYATDPAYAPKVLALLHDPVIAEAP